MKRQPNAFSRRQRTAALGIAGFLGFLIAPSATATAASPGALCPTEATCIVVIVLGPSGFTQTVSLDQLRTWAQDEAGPVTYRIRSRPGGSVTTDIVNQPMPISDLLGHLSTPISVAGVSQVYFDHPQKDAHSTALVPADLGAVGSNGFESGLVPAVYLVGDQQIGYTRPLRAGDPNDVNALFDYWQGSSTTPIEMTVRTEGRALKPQIRATPGTVTMNQKTHLLVSLAGNPDTTGWTYSWHFDDGTTATAPSPAKAWTSSGTYYATVDVSAPDGSWGESHLPVTVTGPSLPKPSPTPGNGGGSNSNPNAPHHGPDQAKGTSTDQNPSTHSGVTTPKGNRTLSTVVPTMPGSGASTVSAFRAVAGTVLVGADGRSVLADSTPVPPGTLDLAAAGARSTTRAGRMTWPWLLLAPLLLLVGAVAELRPWARRRQGS